MGIYIIEDDETMIEILEDLIEDHEMGEVVGSSTDPSEALLQVPALRPDIIMIDFLMPGKDGAQLVRELKAAGCTSKFIMVLYLEAHQPDRSKIHPEYGDPAD